MTRTFLKNLGSKKLYSVNQLQREFLRTKLSLKPGKKKLIPTNKK